MCLKGLLHLSVDLTPHDLSRRRTNAVLATIAESLMYRHPNKAVGAVAFLTVIGCQFA